MRVSVLPQWSLRNHLEFETLQLPDKGGFIGALGKIGANQIQTINILKYVS